MQIVQAVDLAHFAEKRRDAEMRFLSERRCICADEIDAIEEALTRLGVPLPKPDEEAPAAPAEPAPRRAGGRGRATLADLIEAELREEGGPLTPRELRVRLTNAGHAHGKQWKRYQAEISRCVHDDDRFEDLGPATGYGLAD